MRLPGPYPVPLERQRRHQIVILRPRFPASYRFHRAFEECGIWQSIRAAWHYTRANYFICEWPDPGQYRCMAESSSSDRRRAMGVTLDAGYSRFPAVIAVDANKRSGAVDLIFMTRIEGQGAALRIPLTLPQWENLKFLVDGPEAAGS